MWSDLKKAEQHLIEALTIVQSLMKANDPLAPTPEPGFQKNRAWFKDNGVQLSEIGIEKIYQLFDTGYSSEQAAKVMGISLKGAEGRKKKYRESGRNSYPANKNHTA